MRRVDNGHARSLQCRRMYTACVQGHAVPLHPIEDGDERAPVLILAPSLGSTVEMWQPQVETLSTAFRVVRYDHRGHGRSPLEPTSRRWTIADLAADALLLLDRLEVERANFCGLSLGGMVGLWLAAQAPERIDHLVVCCSAAAFRPSAAWLQRAADVRAGSVVAVAERILATWFTPQFSAAHPGVIARMLAMFSGTTDEGYARCCEAIAGTDLTPLLPRIAAPTRVIAAAQDSAAPPDAAHRIAAGVPDCDVVVVDDAAHLANVQHPQTMTDLILDHLLPARRPAPAGTGPS